MYIMPPVRPRRARNHRKKFREAAGVRSDQVLKDVRVESYQSFRDNAREISAKILDRLRHALPAPAKFEVMWRPWPVEGQLYTLW